MERPRPNSPFKSHPASAGQGDEDIRLKDLQVFIKDTHWLTQKNSLLVEKCLLVLDELHQDKTKGKTATIALEERPPSSAQAFSEKGFEDRMAQVIRQTVTEALQPTGEVFRQSVADMLQSTQTDGLRRNEQMIQKSVANAIQLASSSAIEGGNMNGLPKRPNAIQPLTSRDAKEIQDGLIRQAVFDAVQSMESHWSIWRKAAAAGLMEDVELPEQIPVRDLMACMRQQMSLSSNQSREHEQTLHKVLQRTDELGEYVHAMSLAAEERPAVRDQAHPWAPRDDQMRKSATVACSDDLHTDIWNKALVVPETPCIESKLGAPALEKYPSVEEREQLEATNDCAPGKDTFSESGDQLPAVAEYHSNKSGFSKKSASTILLEDLQMIRDAGEEIIEIIVEEVEAVPPRAERIVSSMQFEIVFAVLIVLNTLTMCAEAEYQGWNRGYKLGIPGMQPTTAAVDKVFHIIEISFTVVFTVELMMKVLGSLTMGRKCVFLKSWWNIFDCIIIFMAWFELLVKVNMPINPMLLRLVRLVRLSRLTRSLSKFEALDNLVLMVKGIQAAMPLILWVVVLILPMLACCSLAIIYTVDGFIEDKSNSPKQREDCYMYFGTFVKAMISMFEVTFGNWVPICRFLYANVDAKWAAFFMVYKLVMGIAVIRVVYGVFLHVTFSAEQDDETVIARKERDLVKLTQRLKVVFGFGEEDLTREEFLETIETPRVKALLAAMQLEINSPEVLFALMDDGDCKIGPPEMAHSFSRLKGTARSIDILELKGLTEHVINKLEGHADEFRRLKTHLGLQSPVNSRENSLENSY